MKKLKINIVDIGVLLLIVLMAFAIRSRFQKYNTVDSNDASIEKIAYTIRFSPVRDYTIEAFQSGDTLFDSQTNVAIGTIVGKTYRDYEHESTLMDGSLVKKVQPNRYELELEVETDGVINNAGFYANKTVEIKVGSEKMVETLYAKSTGRITSVKAK